MLQNIIWDVDGTLFDTYPSIAKAFKAALDDLGESVALYEIERLARKSLSYCITALAGQYHLHKDDIEQKFVAYYDLITPEDQPPFPGVMALCEYICAIGGKNVIITHRGQEGTAELLAVHHMAPYFTGCLTRDDGYPRKPDPAAFTAVLKQYCLKSKETIAVGDRDIDVLAGQAAGVSTCFFGSASEGIPADLVISNFDELYQYIVITNK